MSEFKIKPSPFQLETNFALNFDPNEKGGVATGISPEGSKPKSLKGNFVQYLSRLQRDSSVLMGLLRKADRKMCCVIQLSIKLSGHPTMSRQEVTCDS